MTDFTAFTTWLQEQDRSPRTVRAYTVALRDFAAGSPRAPVRTWPAHIRPWTSSLPATSHRRAPLQTDDREQLPRQGARLRALGNARGRRSTIPPTASRPSLRKTWLLAG